MECGSLVLEILEIYWCFAVTEYALVLIIFYIKYTVSCVFSTTRYSPEGVSGVGWWVKRGQGALMQNACPNCNTTKRFGAGIMAQNKSRSGGLKAIPYLLAAVAFLPHPNRRI